MLKRTLIVLLLALAHIGCNMQGEHVWPYDISPLPEEGRLKREDAKRQFLKIEELKVGTGPVAAWGRRILAETEVRYVDGTLIYKGPILLYPGFIAYATNLNDPRLLVSGSQSGIEYGLNGMAVGGKRRFTVHEELVCQGRIDDTGIGRRVACQLTVETKKSRVIVEKRPLVVEATLLDVCNPLVLWRGLYMMGGHLLKWTTCREEEFPRLEPSTPIWHFYVG